MPGGGTGPRRRAHGAGLRVLPPPSASASAGRGGRRPGAKSPPGAAGGAAEPCGRHGGCGGRGETGAERLRWAWQRPLWEVQRRSKPGSECEAERTLIKLWLKFLVRFGVCFSGLLPSPFFVPPKPSQPRFLPRFAQRAPGLRAGGERRRSGGLAL